MKHVLLGRTGLHVSVIALGAGPVPAVMTGNDAEAQRDVLSHALDAGINWIDTAAGYGEGRSEASIGRALRELGAHDRVHVATKVRLGAEDLSDVEGAVRRSLAGSLARLGLPCVTLLQLHNGITPHRGDIAASLAPEDVIGPVAAALRRVRDEGLTRFIGLTGTGDAASLTAVVASGAFDTIQVPHHVLSPTDASLLRTCEEQNLGAFAIRVFAGGALLGREPSAHTLKTPYFPLALYEDDRRRAAELAAKGGAPMKELALRFALGARVPQVAIVGMATGAEVSEVVELAGRAGSAI